MDDEMVTFEQELLEAHDATERARDQTDRIVAQLDEKERQRAALEGKVGMYKGMEETLLEWRDRARVAERDLEVALDTMNTKQAGKRRSLAEWQGLTLAIFVPLVCVCVTVIFVLAVYEASKPGPPVRSVSVTCPVGQPCPILDGP